MDHEREPHFTLGNVGSQQVLVAFDGGCLVSDAGLLTVRALFTLHERTWVKTTRN